MNLDILESILFATIVAGTPLIIVALGQLIAEKSGVLNLGAEGMMAMGAIAEYRQRQAGSNLITHQGQYHNRKQ